MQKLKYVYVMVVICVVATLIFAEFKSGFEGKFIFGGLMLSVLLFTVIPAVFEFRAQKHVGQFGVATGVVVIGWLILYGVGIAFNFQVRSQIDTLLKALESFKNSEGKYPAKIEQLVPKFLPKIPRHEPARNLGFLQYYEYQKPKLEHCVLYGTYPGYREMICLESKEHRVFSD